MNINEIEIKEDSAERLLEVAGKPTKYVLFAPEFNAVVDAVKQILIAGGYDLQTISNNGNITNRVIQLSSVIIRALEGSETNSGDGEVPGAFTVDSGDIDFPNFDVSVDHPDNGNVTTITLTNRNNVNGVWDVLKIDNQGNFYIQKYGQPLKTISLQDKSGTIALLDDISAFIEGVFWKEPAVLFIDTPIPMNGQIPQVAIGTQFQGTALNEGDRVVLTAQGNPVHNGIYRMYIAAGFQRFARTNDANTTAELNNALIPITSGTHANKTFRQTTPSPIIGTNNIVFSQFGNTVSLATNVVPGITKLYLVTGNNQDGTITQKLFTDSLANLAPISLTPRVLLNLPNDSASSTGTTANVIHATCLIKAGSVTGNFSLDFSAYMSKDTTAGITHMRIFHNTVNNLTGASQLANYSADLSTRQSMGINRTFRKRSDNRLVFMSSTNSPTDIINQTNPLSSISYDNNADNYFFFVLAGNAADVLRLNGAAVILYPELIQL